MKKTHSISLVIAVLIGILVVQEYVLLTNQKTPASSSSILPDAASPSFAPWELQAWNSIKNRVIVRNVDPLFTGNRTLQWISMRNSSSGDYYQKSMEYLCFWEGQEANGEWEAVMSIYNSQDSRSDFVVEVARFSWHEIQVSLDGVVVADFSQVHNDTVSLGYYTFHVQLV